MILREINVYVWLDVYLMLSVFVVFTKKRLATSKFIRTRERRDQKMLEDSFVFYVVGGERAGMESRIEERR